MRVPSSWWVRIHSSARSLVEKTPLGKVPLAPLNTHTSGGSGLIPPPSIAQRGLLPKVITAGLDTAPTGALALAETQPGQKYDDSALLARAAELTVTLPPMPIRNVVTSTAPPQPAAAAPQPEAHGGSGVLHSAKVAAQDLARMFGGLPFGAFTTAAPSGDLRGPQQ